MTTHFQPFTRFAKPFAIGLNLLKDEIPGGDPSSKAQLFQPDHKFNGYLAQKRRLCAENPDDIFMAQADTLDAQNEILYLVLNATDTKADQTTLTCATSGHIYQRADYQNKPLWLASLLVQDDLVLMRRKPDGWYLVAASLCFPSSWKLAEKFGKPLSKIHQPVPGANKSLDPMIHRIFDNMKPEIPVWRENWSIYGDDNLRHSNGENSRKKSGEHNKSGDRAFLRREYQTLHRLPVSGDILFTIKILIEPLEIIEEQQDTTTIATNLLAQIGAMSKAEKAYKGFDQGMENVVNYLTKLAGSKNR